MPRRSSEWDAAMRSVDRSAPARASHEIWPYLIPEPSLVLGPADPERQKRYVKNWLRIRLAWLYLLRSSAPEVPPQWWRDYLNGDTVTPTPAPTPDTRRGKRLEEVKKVFGHAFDMSHYQPEGIITWFGYRMRELEPLLCQQVIWELFDLGFRYELLQLDRVLVPLHNQPEAEVLREELVAEVFANRDLYQVNELPVSSAAPALCALVPHARVRCVEALRQVIMRWPLCPQAVLCAQPLRLDSNATTICDVEAQVAGFYVQTFFAYAGRAPLVPHIFP